MRKLLYFPIIHSGADMGSFAASHTQKGEVEFGKEFWDSHISTVSKYWEMIGQYCSLVDCKNKTVKIYQDGMVIDGEIARKIIEDSVKAGSKNYEIISDLVFKGAIIVRTEELSLVKKEIDLLKTIPSSGPAILKIIRILWFKILRARLLHQRDKFIAGRIAETLGPNETGIIFIGAYHEILKRLPKDIHVTEFKEIQKVRTYQKLLPFHSNNKQQFLELSQYLAKPVINNAP
jgi:hypothetical protein